MTILERWCGFCGAVQAFTMAQWDSFYVKPPCPRCGETDWRDEADEIIAPDFKELPTDDA